MGLLDIKNICVLASLGLAINAYAQGNDDQAISGDAEQPQWARPSTQFPDGSEATPETNTSQDDYELADEAENLEIASRRGVRRFHEVLNDLLIEFGYDIKKGQLNGLKNISIRQVFVNEALPKSYRTYLEMLVTERIRENANVRLINCLTCKTKTTFFKEGKLFITSPQTNFNHLTRAGNQLGIENFMDVSLVYHSTHMVLAFQIFQNQSSELVWSRTYNSETIRSKFQKLAVDYRQVAKARASDEYVPEYKFLYGIGGSALPNIGGGKSDSTFVTLQIRAMERFNNRKTEFGLMLDVSASRNSLVFKEDVSQDTPDNEVGPFTRAFTLYGMFSHMFIGSVESYNNIRHGLHLGAGPVFAKNYLSSIFRIGYDAYFGRRWVVSLAGKYVLPSTYVHENEELEAKGGVAGDIILSLNI